MASTSLIFMRTFPLRLVPGHRLSPVWSYVCPALQGGRRAFWGRGLLLIRCRPPVVPLAQGGQTSSLGQSVFREVPCVQLFRPTCWTRFLRLCSYLLAAAKSQADFPSKSTHRFRRVEPLGISGQMASIGNVDSVRMSFSRPSIPRKLCPSWWMFLKNPLTNRRPECNLISSL